MKNILYILIIILLVSCFDTRKINSDYYVYLHKTPMGIDKHELSINYDSTFSYDYVTYMYGKTSGQINGTWYRQKDSLCLRLAYPFDFKIKKSFIDYSTFGSPDSLYILTYDLYPEILSINQHIYRSISLSAIDTCRSDTCFDEKIVVLRKNYSHQKRDTLKFFDPNDFLVDKSMPIRIDTFNCIKVYRARKVKYDFLDIPTRYKYVKNRLYFRDSSGKNKYFKMTKK